MKWFNHEIRGGVPVWTDRRCGAIWRWAGGSAAATGDPTEAEREPSCDFATERFGWVTAPCVDIREKSELPARVSTLDELMLILSRDTPLRFDPTLGFHLYGADFCLQAAEPRPCGCRDPGAVSAQHAPHPDQGTKTLPWAPQCVRPRGPGLSLPWAHQSFRTQRPRETLPSARPSAPAMPRGDQGTKTLPWAPQCVRHAGPRVEFAVGTPILSHAEATGDFALGTPECSGHATRGPGHEDFALGTRVLSQAEPRPGISAVRSGQISLGSFAR